MQLTRHTDYGLRTLVYLALRPDERITAAEIADAFEVSQNHLQKVVQHLAGFGVVHTQRGKNGGITLAESPDSIRVGAVVRALEEGLDIVNCTRPWCPVLPACRLKGVLSNARDAFLAVLDDCTLADLLRDREGALHELLSKPEKQASLSTNS